AALNQLAQEPVEWLIPGWLREKVIGLMKSLPKALRVKFVPVPENAERILPALRAMNRRGNLLDVLADQLGKLAGEYIDREAFSLADLEAYLRVNFQVVDDQGQLVQSGRDLDAIKRELGLRARQTFRAQLPPGEWNRDGLITWDFE